MQNSQVKGYFCKPAAPRGWPSWLKLLGGSESPGSPELAGLGGACVARGSGGAGGKGEVPQTLPVLAIPFLPEAWCSVGRDRPGDPGRVFLAGWSGAAGAGEAGPGTRPASAQLLPSPRSRSDPLPLAASPDGLCMRQLLRIYSARRGWVRLVLCTEARQRGPAWGGAGLPSLQPPRLRCGVGGAASGRSTAGRGRPRPDGSVRAAPAALAAAALGGRQGSLGSSST